MRKWKWEEPADESATSSVTIVVTEEEIIRDYYPWWKAKMESLGRHDKISHENCIEDFVIINWAEEVNE